MDSQLFQVSTGYDTLPPKGSAATEEVVFNLSNVLSKFIKLNVVGIGKNNFHSKRIRFFRVYLPKFLSKRTTPRTLKHIFKRLLYSLFVVYVLFKKVKRDAIIHFHNQYNCFIFCLFKPIFFKSSKIVYTCHNPILSLDNKNKLFGISFIEKFCFKHVDLTIALSDKAYKNIRRYSNNTKLIPNGVNLNFNHQPFEVKQGLKILFIGRITPIKNQLLLLKALRILRKKKSNIQLTLVGPVDDKDYYTKIIKFVKKNNLSNNFLYLGEVPRRKIEQQYKKNDVFVVPSLSEGSSLVILEAMANNKPLFVYKREYSKSFYNGKNCVLFKSPKELSGNILKCMNSKVCFKKLLQAEQEYIKKYSWENIAKRLLNAYYSII